MLRGLIRPFPPGTQKTLWMLLAAAAALLALWAVLPGGGGQLLPPCALYSATGICCPGCGGTRAVESLLRGQWLQSAHYHILVPYAAAVGGLFLFSPVFRRLTGRPFLLRPVHLYLAALLLLVQWGARLLLFLLGRPVF